MGLAAHRGLPADYRQIAIAGIGIATFAMGTKMFLASRNPLIPIGSLILGGLLGHVFGLQAAIDALGRWAQQATGGGEGFAAVFVVTSILFCVGPMTLLGCLEDGLEGNFHLLAIKSILDGISALFFAAASGAGVLLSAATVLVVQTPLTLGARAFGSCWRGGASWTK